jgi:hypothetical protein
MFFASERPVVGSQAGVKAVSPHERQTDAIIQPVVGALQIVV